MGRKGNAPLCFAGKAKLTGYSPGAYCHPLVQLFSHRSCSFCTRQMTVYTLLPPVPGHREHRGLEKSTSRKPGGWASFADSDRDTADCTHLPARRKVRNCRIPEKQLCLQQVPEVAP